MEALFPNLLKGAVWCSHNLPSAFPAPPYYTEVENWGDFGVNQVEIQIPAMQLTDLTGRVS